MLNTMFAIFDHLTDRNSVYKVETVKDSFVGVSGAPDRVPQAHDYLALVTYHLNNWFYQICD